ncbi:MULTISPECIES: DMT family transporter [pseudomallei group]|uniref:DMT family transporter n=2 Tax=Burkholderiaceae TaxID=119060 RepID=A0A7U4P374_9BURK|nr:MULTISPECIES: DMT family transporter [pseudomallei group]AJY42150.1 hypothetical protein BW21_1448 [Burkholderia sp. 2002721687]KVN18802.1 hypothetical protein WT08_01495 [Burkholderia sp. MSMB1552]KWZ56405.1 hypothetical protein WS92_11215 [Burkholderia sp. MSMB1588]ALX42131.1 hypothetical protein AQ610_06615 [Burkholderia humptydooensis]KGC37998.1 hypothetical protein DO62_5506 [Burkholderia pseudomallei]
MTMKTRSREWWIDRAALLGVAVLCAGLAWLFSIGAGKWSTLILATVVFVALLLDNHRLRKELKRYRDK